MTVPTFYLRDLEALLGPNADQSVLRAFRECLNLQGVFYLSDPSLAEEVHAAARTKAMEFFAKGDAKAKQRMVSTQTHLRRGYLALGHESTAKSTNLGDYVDLAMAFSMGEHSNLFPDEEFANIWSKYFAAVKAASHRLWHVTRVLYKLDNIPTDDVLRLRYYPDVGKDRAAEVEPLRVAPHHDVSVYTLIHQTPCVNGFVSLQCEWDGVYHEVPTIPGTMVVQVGAVLSVMSRGALKSPKHRIAAPPLNLIQGSSRSALVYHIRPQPYVPISVREAHRLGFGDRLRGDIATFGEWVGGNYARIHKL